jgi:predicted Holliday junction resolvase-like endonuclease
LTVEGQVKEIVLIEVKGGTGRLSNVQRYVVQSVDQGRIHSEVWEIGNPKIPIAHQLHGTRRVLPPADDK